MAKRRKKRKKSGRALTSAQLQAKKKQIVTMLRKSFNQITKNLTHP